MSFVRKKEYDGRVYYFLVKSIRDGNKVRQKVIKYLGKNKPSKEEIKKLLAE